MPVPIGRTVINAGDSGPLEAVTATICSPVDSGNGTVQPKIASMSTRRLVTYRYGTGLPGAVTLTTGSTANDRDDTGRLEACTITKRSPVISADSEGLSKAVPILMGSGCGVDDHQRNQLIAFMSTVGLVTTVLAEKVEGVAFVVGMVGAL